MYCIDNDRCRFADFFGWCGDSMIPSYFEGHTGSAVAENENDPRWVIIRTGDFYFAAGQPENIADAVGGFIKRSHATGLCTPGTVSAEKNLKDFSGRTGVSA